jgi:hypothetical protein
LELNPRRSIFCVSQIEEESGHGSQEEALAQRSGQTRFVFREFAGALQDLHHVVVDAFAKINVLQACDHALVKFAGTADGVFKLLVFRHDPARLECLLFPLAHGSLDRSQFALQGDGLRLIDLSGFPFDQGEQPFFPADFRLELLVAWMLGQENPTGILEFSFQFAQFLPVGCRVGRTRAGCRA